MEQVFIDSITNVRMVMGTIRMDAMNITKQTEDKKLQIEKRAEIIMTPAGFNQVLRTLQEVEGKMQEQAKQAQEKQAEALTDKSTKGKKN